MKINLGLFFGGKSVEHEVAVISASQTLAALDPEKYEVIPIYITKDNELYTGQALKDIANFKDIKNLLSQCQQVVLQRDKRKVNVLRYPAKLFSNPLVASLDLAFPVVHGTNVEDGSIQGLFQLLSLPYVGSDVGASAVGMDKWASKCLLQGAGLPVLPGYCFNTTYYFAGPEKVAEKLEGLFAYPMMVKPVNLGSSVGVMKAGDRQSLLYAIELAASFAQRILVEPVVQNLKEVNCAVLGDFEYTEASACEEPISSGELLSYADKYQAGGKSDPAAEGAKGMGSAKRKLPAEIDGATEARVKDLAQKAFLALNCSGVARVDFLIDQADGQIYINELNTIPGSLSFYLWEAAGKDFRRLTEDMINLALKRERQQKQLIWSNSVNILAGYGGGTKGGKA
ncbi:MAG: D-alanine--D-alanine ligase family protein [Peptococcaceae bacterium]|nr:D-alanine--D-alanine ligase family protein [Peptococcaceae bacterium]